MEKLVRKVIKHYGGVNATQKRFGYESPEAVYMWLKRGVPKKHVLKVHKDTGLPLDKLLAG